mmetsp:Transcript_2918/g.8532  ORF Transcript_2918/g.8532 Transcript_2918/m.8532 type:complete len:214 (-) Transcript_2918:4002-4643(-)
MVRPHSGSGDLMMAVMNVGGGAPPMRPRLSAAHHAQQLQTLEAAPVALCSCACVFAAPARGGRVGVERHPTRTPLRRAIQWRPLRSGRQQLRRRHVEAATWRRPAKAVGRGGGEPSGGHGAHEGGSAGRGACEAAEGAGSQRQVAAVVAGRPRVAQVRVLDVALFRQFLQLVHRREGLANGMGCSDCVILRVHERVGLPAIPLAHVAALGSLG